LSELLAIYGAFMLVTLSGALSPGPLTAVALSEGVRAGRGAGVKLALGHALVEFPLVLAIAYGLGQFLQRPLVNGLVALFGAAVLLWMGYGLVSGVLRRQLSLRAAAAAPAPAMLRYGHVPGGAALTVTNPYWSLWWASLGATYVARTAALSPGLLPVSGLWFTHWLIDLGWLGGLSLIVSSGRGLIGDRAYRGVLLFCGLFLIGFGIFFAWSGAQSLAVGR
jgi:threonine/homoserine/homoserine lactone efflux protein